MRTLDDMPRAMNSPLKPGLVHLLEIDFRGTKLEAGAAWFDEQRDYKKSFLLYVFDYPSNFRSMTDLLVAPARQALEPWLRFVATRGERYVAELNEHDHTFSRTSEGTGTLVLDRCEQDFGCSTGAVASHLSAHDRLALLGRPDVLHLRQSAAKPR